MTELSTAGIPEAARRLRALADSLQADLAPALDRLALPPAAFGALIEVYRWYDRTLEAVTAAGQQSGTELSDAAADLVAFAAVHEIADEDAAAAARRAQP